MSIILLSLLLCAQLTFAAPSAAPARPSVEPRQLWWGLIDPELSAWFTRIPDESDSQDSHVLWNWSWRSFWAALTNQTLIKETSDAARL